MNGIKLKKQVESILAEHPHTSDAALVFRVLMRFYDASHKLRSVIGFLTWLESEECPSFTSILRARSKIRAETNKEKPYVA